MFKWHKSTTFRKESILKPWLEEKLEKTLEKPNKRQSLDLQEQVYSFQLEESTDIWRAEALQLEGNKIFDRTEKRKF